MTEVVAAARNARESLAQGLSALQSPGVPENLIAAAEPIAKAMSQLHRIEATGGQAALEAAPVALDSVRAALALLQTIPTTHPAVNAALEAVAGSLGLVHRLNQTTGSQRPGPAPVAQPQNPGLGSTIAVGAPAVAIPPQPQMNTVVAQPSPVANFAATTPAAPAPAPAAPAAAPRFAPMAQPQPVASPAMGDTRQSAGVPAMAMPDARFEPNSTLPSQGNARSPIAQAGTAAVTFGSAPTQPEAGALAPAAPTAPAGALAPVPAGAVRIEAALGAHSPTNFYKGLSGNNVVDAGGIFVATYQIPKIRTNLVLHVSLPGGYEFQAQGVVRWTREPSSVSDGASPGFGAQITSISPEGRQLVYRYVRNREPLFHDDF
ncbi:MAG: hypothetical protein QM784_27190 [Polyangiaceae bacterium]